MNILEMMTRDHDEALAGCKRLGCKAESSDDHGKGAEELEMCPRLRRAFDADQLAEMGALMEAEKAHLREHLAPQLRQAATAP